MDVRWYEAANGSVYILPSNDRTIKLWKIECSGDARVARCRRVFAHAHDFSINSISVNRLKGGIPRQMLLVTEIIASVTEKKFANDGSFWIWMSAQVWLQQLISMRTRWSWLISSIVMHFFMSLPAALLKTTLILRLDLTESCMAKPHQDPNDHLHTTWLGETTRTQQSAQEVTSFRNSKLIRLA